MHKCKTIKKFPSSCNYNEMEVALTKLEAMTGEAAVTAQAARKPQATPLSSFKWEKPSLDSEEFLLAAHHHNNKY